MIKKKIEIGELVKSVSGHDADGYFIVVDMSDEFVWLCDGKNRKATHLKKKNKKHIATTGIVVDWVRENPGLVNNTSVRNAIKELLKKEEV